MRRLLISVGLIGWLGAVGAGLWLLWGYTAAAGLSAEAPASWPRASTLPREADRPTLVLFFHPRCPCSRATVEELAHLLAAVKEPPRVDAVLVDMTDGGDPHWSHTDLRRSLEALPGVTVLDDRGAVEAGRFGVHTSGQTFLYDAQGALRFTGGITAGRGHSGDNAGLDTLATLINHEPAARISSATPVYGCSLATPTPSSGARASCPTR